MMEYLNSEDGEGNLEIKYLKGIASVGMGKYDEADRYFTELENDATADAAMQEKVKFNKMRNYFLWEKYDEAINYGESYLTLENPENKNEALDKLAISYFRKDNFEKSREYYLKLANEKGFEAYGRFQIAESYYSEKNYEKAKEEYKYVVDNYGDSTYGEKAFYWYLTILLNSGDTVNFEKGKNDYEKAKEEYKYVVDNYGDSTYGEKAFYWYLTILLNSGDTVNFEKGKNEFLVKYPVSRMKDTLLMMSGEIYENSNDNEKALKNYEELYSSSVDPTVKDNTSAKILDIHLAKNNLKAAQKYIEGITNLDIKSYYDSLIYEKQGNKKAATAKILDIHLAKNNLKAAQKYIEGITNLDIKSYYDSLIYEKQGNKKAAMAEYEKLLNSPRYKDYACINIGSNYFKNKKYKEAKKYYLFTSQ